MSEIYSQAAITVGPTFTPDSTPTPTMTPQPTPVINNPVFPNTTPGCDLCVYYNNDITGNIELQYNGCNSCGGCAELSDREKRSGSILVSKCRDNTNTPPVDAQCWGCWYTWNHMTGEYDLIQRPYGMDDTVYEGRITCGLCEDVTGQAKECQKPSREYFLQTGQTVVFSECGDTSDLTPPAPTLPVVCGGTCTYINYLYDVGQGIYPIYNLLSSSCTYGCDCYADTSQVYNLLYTVPCTKNLQSYCKSNCKWLPVKQSNSNTGYGWMLVKDGCKQEMSGKERLCGECMHPNVFWGNDMEALDVLAKRCLSSTDPNNSYDCRFETGCVEDFSAPIPPPAFDPTFMKCGGLCKHVWNGDYHFPSIPPNPPDRGIWNTTVVNPCSENCECTAPAKWVKDRNGKFTYEKIRGNFNGQIMYTNCSSKNGEKMDLGDNTDVLQQRTAYVTKTDGIVVSHNNMEIPGPLTDKSSKLTDVLPLAKINTLYIPPST
jgi:hypothetical protein